MKKTLSLLLLAFTFFNCANQLPPDGGPVDKEPPIVIRTFPESGTLNYNKNFVEIEFSEFINKRNVLNSIFVSPYFTDDLEIKWKGKKLRIIFPEKLKDNKTYVISIGTDITDLRGNKLAENVILRFSTGDKIDDGIISGKVFDQKPDGVMIFFYLIDSLNEKVRYDSTRPDFICQTSKDGSFTLFGLPNGIFRIVAVRDQMRNLFYDLNEDEIGFPVRDYVLSDSIRKIDNVFFELVKLDTAKPILNSVKFVDLNHIKLNFNEAINTNSINLENIILYDSSGIQSKLYGFLFSDKNSITIITEDLNPFRDYLIEVSGIKDLAGNEMDKIKINFYTEDFKDTIIVGLKNLECNFSTSVMEYFNPVCTLYFSDYVSKEKFLNAINVEDTLSRKINFSINRTDSANFILQFPELKQREKLNLKINLGQLQNITKNKIDSILIKTIETNSESDYGSISGLIRNRKLVKDLSLEMKNLNHKKTYYHKIEGDNYLFKNILPGSYLLKLTLQENEEREIKNFSKPFIYYPDTIKVKSRWPTTDVNFDVNDLLR